MTAARTIGELVARGTEEATKVLVERGATVDVARKLLCAAKVEQIYLEFGEWTFLEGLMVMFEAQGAHAKLSVQWPEREPKRKPKAKPVQKRKRRRRLNDAGDWV